MFTHFSPKTTIFGLLRGHFWPKTWKIKCFQFIQSKISQFVTQMWLPKKLQFLVPGTPPEPPIPPLTPPRGPGGPKMAKMHSLKSIDDNLCQKSHFWGVKKIDLFFHSECTSRGRDCSKAKFPLLQVPDYFIESDRSLTKHNFSSFLLPHIQMTKETFSFTACKCEL